jgi:putative ABC transport system permease protein
VNRAGFAWAVRELWRRRGRFAGVTVTLSALCTLAVILVSVAAGLWAGATGALSRSPIDLVVFSRDSLSLFPRSRIALAAIPTAGRVPGVAAVGALGTLTTTMALPGGMASVAVIGAIPGRPGAPAAVVSGRLPRSGEDSAAVDVALRAEGVRLGSQIRSPAGGPPLRVVGFVADQRFELLPTVWATISAWQALSGAARPETRTMAPAAQVLTIRLTPDADAARVARAVDARLGATTLTRGQAILAIPGAAAMRSTINELIAAVLVVAAGVTALFAALYTAERRGELARLRALGASGARLAAGLLAQAEAPVIIAAAAAYAITAALIAAAPPQFPVTLPLSRALGLAGLIVAAGAAGTALSVLRVLRIDPSITVEEL